jgi:transcriptional regulator with XRE-family HTH domain
MPSVITPAKRAFGSTLARLHKRSGLAGGEVAKVLGCDPSTITRYLKGRTLPQPADLQTLLNLYDATPADRTEVADLLAAARGGTQRLRAPDAPPKMRSYLRAEADADSVWTLNPSAVPGLLQTEAYATAIHSMAHALGDPAISVEQAVASRMRRQRRLTLDPDPLRLHSIIDEAVIHRTAALGRMGRAQLDHLATLAARPNIVVQVVPFAVGIYGTMTGPMTRFGYPGKGDDAAVYLEYPGGGAWVRGEEVRSHELLFTEVGRVALSPADTMSMLDKAVRRT